MGIVSLIKGTEAPPKSRLWGFWHLISAASAGRTALATQTSISAQGSSHAQFLFQSDQSDRVMREIRRFLPAPQVFSDAPSHPVTKSEMNLSTSVTICRMT